MAGCGGAPAGSTPAIGAERGIPILRKWDGIGEFVRGAIGRSICVRGIAGWSHGHQVPSFVNISLDTSRQTYYDPLAHRVSM